jgi:hypothetical protein
MSQVISTCVCCCQPTCNMYGGHGHVDCRWQT